MARKQSSNSSNNNSLNHETTTTTTSKTSALILIKKYCGKIFITVCFSIFLLYIYSYIKELQTENENLFKENKTLKRDLLDSYLKQDQYENDVYSVNVFYDDCLEKERKLKNKLNKLAYTCENFKKETKKALSEMKKKFHNYQFKEEGCDAFSFLNRTFWKVKENLENFF